MEKNFIKEIHEITEALNNFESVFLEKEEKKEISPLSLNIKRTESALNESTILKDFLEEE